MLQYVPKPTRPPIVNKKPEMPKVFIIKKKRKLPPTMKTEPGIKAEQREPGALMQPVIKKEKITGEGHIKKENTRVGPVQPLVVNAVLPPVVRGAGPNGACDGNIGKPKNGAVFTGKSIFLKSEARLDSLFKPKSETVSTGKGLFKPRSEGASGGQSLFTLAPRNEEKRVNGKLDRKEQSSRGNKMFTNAVFVDITSD